MLDLNAAQVALSSIPEEAIDSALDCASKSGGARSPKEALESLRREQTLAAEERELQAASAQSHAPPGEGGGGKGGSSTQTSADAADAEHAERLSREQIHDIAEAVATMSDSSAVKKEREEMKRLEQEREEHRREIEEATGESSQVAMLNTRVTKMMESLREEVERVDSELGQTLHTIDLDGDGEISRDELVLAMESLSKEKRPQAAQFKQVLEQLDPDSDGRISLKDIRRVVNEMELNDEDD